jgi:broad-specificity NMP kinase
MPLIYVTGNSGVGKSSVRKELQRRGYEAHDTDEDGISSWQNKATNEPVEYPDDRYRRTKEWYGQHEWRISRQKVKEFVARAKNKPIFLCGSPTNADDMLDLYDKVICLTIDKQTLQHRIAARTDNDYGKAPNELSDILGWHESFQERYKNYGVVLIDAGKPLNEVVDEILTKTIDFAQIGQASLQAFVQTIKKLAESGEPFDVTAAAGDSGQLAARIAEEVFKALGKPVPPKLVAPVYRHADEAETILFDNTILAPQFESWKMKPLSNILFVDDEIGSGNAARGMLDLLLEINPSIQAYTIVAEDGGFDCPPEIQGIKAIFISTRQRVPNTYNAISHTVPWKFQKPLKEVLVDEPDLNDKQIMCTLLNLPTKEFNDGKPEFNDRLIKRAQEALPYFAELQEEYQKHFVATIKGCL